MCCDTAASEIPSLRASAPEHMSCLSRIARIENLVPSDMVLRSSSTCPMRSSL